MLLGSDDIFVQPVAKALQFLTIRNMIYLVKMLRHCMFYFLLLNTDDNIPNS